MQVLVVGATGRTGRELVKQARAAGHDVTALVRDAAKLPDEPEVRVESKGQGGFMYARVIAPLFMKKILVDQDRHGGGGCQQRSRVALVRATRLTDGPAMGQPEVIFSGGAMSSKVSRTDTATFMVRQLDDPTYVRKGPGLSN